MRRAPATAAVALSLLILAGVSCSAPFVGGPTETEFLREQDDEAERPQDGTDSRAAITGDRQSATRLSSAVGFAYTGPIGPQRPLDVGYLDIRTGRHEISYSLPARFAGLTSDPLVCSLVESRSGIPLEPAESATFANGAGWTVVRTDLQMALPEMTIALRCSTAEETIGEVEIGESSLSATKVG